MGRRKTNKTGIVKPRIDDPQLQRAFDAIIERLEVLDGIRGDQLDKAVTYRELEETGFTLGVGAGGSPTIVNTPGSGTGGGGTPIPEIGPPSGPPTSLAANETYLALLLTWVNPGFNLQHIQVWRNDVDNLSTATLIGTTVSPQFVDYVGAEQSYYYWVRAVGTDGTFSAYNDTAGTVGTTGVDPGNLTIDPRFFALEDGTGTELPFLTDGEGSIGIDGDLIVNETIRAQSLVAGSIGVDQLVSNEVSGIFASFGVMQGGRIRTAEHPAFRVILEDQAATSFPLWYGSGSRGAANGLFYVTEFGDVVVKGLLDAGIIKQSYFTPAGANDSWRIATEYPNEYSGGVYSGKEAHLFPISSINQQPTGGNSVIGTAHISSPFYSDEILFYGPVNSNSIRYLRLGSRSELFWVQWSIVSSVTVGLTVDISVEYQYDTEGWRPVPGMQTVQRFVNTGGVTEGSMSFSGTCISRSTAFDELRFRVSVTPGTGGVAVASIYSMTATVMSPNFGFADASVAARMD